MFMSSTSIVCPSEFSMRSMQLLCVIEYLFCMPEAVLWDCCSFNYSLILKDQRSLPQSTPCISLELHTHTVTCKCFCAHVHWHGQTRGGYQLCSVFGFCMCFIAIIRRIIWTISVGLFKFSIEEPSMLFLILLLGEIFLYQPKACTSPQKGVTDHPLAWGMKHVLFSWSAFMSVCVCVCGGVCVSRPHVLSVCISVSLPFPPCFNTGPDQSAPLVAEVSSADRLLQYSVHWHLQFLRAPMMPLCCHQSAAWWLAGGEDAECN